MKKKYSRLRELWAVPSYKLFFKFGGWLIFFVIFFILHAITSSMPQENIKVSSVSYNKMKETLTGTGQKIKYSISSKNNYLIEGTLIDNVIEGTIETAESETVEKIKIDTTGTYLIKKGVAEKSEILNEINTIYLFPKNILEIINNNSSLLRQAEDGKIYSYNIDNRAYSVYLNDKAITKFIILDGIITYELEYSAI